MADIYSTTPGSAVADTVQQILQRRREDARQAMMDRLGIEKYRTDSENQAAQLGLERQRTEAQVAGENERRIAEKLKTLRYGETNLNDINDDELLRVIASRGLSKEVPSALETPPQTGAVPATPHLEGEGPGTTQPTAITGEGEVPVFRASATAPPKRVYVGSQDFQKKQEADSDIDRYIAAHPNEDPDTLRALALSRAVGADLPASIVGPKPSITPISPQGTARTRIDLPRGGQGMEMNYPPQGPRAQFIGVDINSGRPMNMNPDGSYSLGVLPPNTTLGPKPTAAHPQAIVDPRFVLALGATLRQTNINPKQRNMAFQQSKTNILSAANTTPEVKQWLSLFMDDLKRRADSGIPPPQPQEAIMWAQAGIEGMSDQEYAAITSLIPLFLSNTQ